MASFDINLDDIYKVLSNDHMFELNFPTVESSPNFPSTFDITICESLNINIDESLDYSFELQVGVPYEFIFLCKLLASHNDGFAPTNSTIDFKFDLPIEFYLLCVGPQALVLMNLCWYTKVIYSVEVLKFHKTHILVTMNTYLFMYLLHIIMVLLFLQYRTLS